MTNRSARPRAAVTGVSGYLGGKVASRLLDDGWEVVGLGRRPAGLAGVEHAPFRLGEAVRADRLEGVDVLIHCAWDLRQRAWPDIEEVNVRGTERLFAAASIAAVKRLIHISTVSASGSPRSLYGRSKLLTEKMAEERGGIVVRPGLLYGPNPGGMVGALSTLVRLLPVVPVLVGADRPLFLAHQDDIAMLLALTARGDEGDPGGPPLVGAARDPHSLREVLAAIAAAHDVRRLFFRVPWRAIYLPLRAMELAHLPSPMRADSALSIATLDPSPFASGASPAAMSFRAFEPSALMSETGPVEAGG